ncbi:hypothetical protein DSO57_1024226 [Entomophthora muscae]|uniref:Uncharacterized protein n=1 Tax=Entomophthora muscae TaxID=34485 RepID=A0ACC2TDP7_9FUNG|nr:hypothetical protein DSO57_1024226 [Entomophthora muscae]
MIGSMEDIFTTRPDFHISRGSSHIPCFAHILNLIVQAGLTNVIKVKPLKESEEGYQEFESSTSDGICTSVELDMPSLINRIHCSIKSIKHLSYNNGFFLNHQNASSPIELSLDVVTRWNSTYYMLKSLVELKNSFNQKIIHFPTMNEGDYLKADEVNALINLDNFLKPFERATQLI